MEDVGQPLETIPNATQLVVKYAKSAHAILVSRSTSFPPIIFQP
jgi:hypothetical protein